MNILLIDIDTLRPDHLGCYGYKRPTSPNIDSVAREGALLLDHYCSDAPCLPSRAALVTGQFGIHNGVVGHGGTAADRRLDGALRAMQDRNGRYNLFSLLQAHGYYTVSASSFAARHGAWWFHAGLREMYDPGKNGHETAELVIPWVLDWLNNNSGKPGREQWFMHLNLWDTHAPARTPKDVSNPFLTMPLSDDWIDQAQIDDQRKNRIGPHSAMEVSGYNDTGAKGAAISNVRTTDDFKRNIDNYDLSLLYADRHIGMVLDKLRVLGIYEETAIIITSDHGEDLGEMGIYNEHGQSDYHTTHIPFIIKWPGIKGGTICRGLHYNVDLIPTLMELLGGWRSLPIPRVCGEGPAPLYDGESFAPDLLTGSSKTGREFLVMSQCAHVCQRSVRFADWLYIRTYHDGYHLCSDDQLYCIADDPHQINDLANQYQEVCWHGAWYLEHWLATQMKKMSPNCTDDPLWRVIGEGGPFHCKGYLADYCDRLEHTDRSWAAEELKKRHPNELYPPHDPHIR